MILTVVPNIRAVSRHRKPASDPLRTNTGPMFTPSVPVSGRTYSRVGLRVGGPAFVAAVVTLLATNALLG